MNEEFLHKKLDERKQLNAFRKLRLPEEKVDFCSNDYLGVVKSNLLSDTKLPSDRERFRGRKTQNLRTGSTGSRLLSGNYPLIEEVETLIAAFHQSESALIFNSGYDANIGLLSCIPQRGDTILYDYLGHASIRDGTRLSLAQAFSFQHNDPDDLEKKLQLAKGNVFVVTESVFSMDGDMAPLQEIIHCCEKHNARLIVDEAHATGIIGERGEGLVQPLGLQHQCFARVHTFGKALGVHGAAVLGSKTLKDYLINFSRPFIYTTALPETAIVKVQESYQLFPLLTRERELLTSFINQFQISNFKFQILKSKTPIQSVIIPGNEAVKKIADVLQENQIDVRPILYPTVPIGQERLRIILHAFNTTEELDRLTSLLS